MQIIFKASSKKCKICKFCANLAHFADSAWHTSDTEFFTKFCTCRKTQNSAGPTINACLVISKHYAENKYTQIGFNSQCQVYLA